MEYNNIIVAFDGSETSRKAFKQTIQIAKNNDSRVISTKVVDSRTFATVEAYDQTIANRAESYAKELIDEHVQEAKNAGLSNLIRCIEYGSPKVIIAKDIAKTFNADLIICGATGLNAVERFLIGSVSESITRYAICDVLVVR